MQPRRQVAPEPEPEPELKHKQEPKTDPEPEPERGAGAVGYTRRMLTSDLVIHGRYPAQIAHYAAEKAGYRHRKSEIVRLAKILHFRHISRNPSIYGKIAQRFAGRIR